MSANISAASVVTAGPVKFGNHLPISIIAGPCQLESRSHALEVASALKEIAGRLKIGLVYKTSFDKANRSSGSAPRGIGLAQALPIFAEIRSSLGLPVLTDVHESSQCAEVAQAVDVLQIPAYSVPADRSAAGGGGDRQGRQRQEGAVPGAVGHGQRRQQDHRRRQSQRAGHRARRIVWLQHAGVGHARVADPGAHAARPSFSMRPIRCSSPGGRVLHRAASANSWRCSPAPRSRSALPVSSSRPTPIPTTHRRDGPNMVPLREFEALVKTLMEFDALAKRAARQ